MQYVTQIVKIAANVDGLIAEIAHTFEGPGCILRNDQRSFFQVDRQHRQSLIEVVVKFAGKPTTLFLLGL